jgi:hypothetical protein
LFDGCNDIWIRSAATKIAAHILANVSVTVCMAFVYASHSRHDLARRTITALKCIIVDERLLHRVQTAVASKPLDGRNSATLRGYRERQTRNDAPAVNMNGTGAALAMIAAFLRSGELQMLAKKIKERGPNVERQLMLLPIDGKNGCGRFARLSGRQLNRFSVAGTCEHWAGSGRDCSEQKRTPIRAGDFLVLVERIMRRMIGHCDLCAHAAPDARPSLMIVVNRPRLQQFPAMKEFALRPRVMLPRFRRGAFTRGSMVILPAVPSLLSEREPIALNISNQIAPERDTDALSCRGWVAIMDLIARLRGTAFTFLLCVI